MHPYWHNCSSWYLLTVLSCYFLLFYIFRPISPNLDPCWHNCSSNDICLPFHLFLFIFRPVSPDPVCGAGTHFRLMIFAYRSILFFILRPVSPDPVRGAGTQLLVLIFAYRSILVFMFRPVSPDPVRGAGTQLLVLIFAYRSILVFVQASITWPCTWCWHTCSSPVSHFLTRGKNITVSSALLFIYFTYFSVSSVEISVADPVSGAFLTPGSGIQDG